MTAEAALVVPSTATSGVQPVSISTSWAPAPPSLLDVVPETSTLTASLPLTATFGDLASDRAAISITATRSAFVAPTVTITGSTATNYNAFANLTPGNLLSALKSVGSALTSVSGSSLLSAELPFTHPERRPGGRLLRRIR